MQKWIIDPKLLNCSVVFFFSWFFCCWPLFWNQKHRPSYHILNACSSVLLNTHLLWHHKGHWCLRDVQANTTGFVSTVRLPCYCTLEGATRHRAEHADLWGVSYGILLVQDWPTVDLDEKMKIGITWTPWMPESMAWCFRFFKQAVYVVRKCLQLFPYALCQTRVGVGTPARQIEGRWSGGGGDCVGGCMCMCVCIRQWNNTPRHSSDHTDSLPAPAVPQIHFTAAFLHPKGLAASSAARLPQ